MLFDADASITNITAIRKDLDPLHTGPLHAQTQNEIGARIQDALRDIVANCHSTYSPAERHEYCERLGNAVTELQGASVEDQIRRCALRCRHILGCLLGYLESVRQRGLGTKPEKTVMIQNVIE